MLLFKGGLLIYTEHCIYIYINNQMFGETFEGTSAGFGSTHCLCLYA